MNTRHYMWKIDDEAICLHISESKLCKTPCAQPVKQMKDRAPGVFASWLCVCVKVKVVKR